MPEVKFFGINTIWSCHGNHYRSYFGIGIAFGFSPAVSFVSAMGFVLTSTAVVMQLLGERGDTATPRGQRVVAILLFEDVLLSGGDELQALGRFAGGPLVPVETMHQVAGDAVFLQHHRDGLRRVEGRVPLAAALGVSDERLLELIGEAATQVSGFS